MLCKTYSIRGKVNPISPIYWKENEGIIMKYQKTEMP